MTNLPLSLEELERLERDNKPHRNGEIWARALYIEYADFKALIQQAKKAIEYRRALALMMPWAERGFYGGGSPEEYAEFEFARKTLEGETK